jgi:4-diphosphocytidyl-2-C-methyl-D-erythritol kinase
VSRAGARLAPAKLNLYLHVTGRRADGSHLLDSLVAFTDIGDRLTVEPDDRLALEITGPFARDLAATPREENLVWRAAEALARRLGRAPAARLKLEKNLPAASGIGGGSSDAAAALHGLAALWRAGLNPADLARIGATLGADVPACLAGKSVFVGGIGEQIEKAPVLPPVALVLANPGKALPTTAVFGARQGLFSKANRFVKPPKDAAELAAWLATRGNDLTDAAAGLVPEIRSVLAALGDCVGSLLARMSGSGATCFALFGDAALAEKGASRLRAGHPGWWISSGTLI